tara:strand:+ start:945 stop:2003 length:1059 start_codon:yes stop_codon:yes gene_type:complete
MQEESGHTTKRQLTSIDAIERSLAPFGLEAHSNIPHFQSSLAHVTTPLPGAEPYRRVREFSVTGQYDCTTLGEFLTHRYPHVPVAQWQDAVEAGDITVESQPVRDWGRELRAGMRLRHDIGWVTEPAIATSIEVLYHDAHFLALAKPAPLPVHASGRFFKNTLITLLQEALGSELLRPPHRLDADTSGVQLLAKTRAAAATLTKQFATRTVAKHYLARVDGHPNWQQHEVTAAVARGPGHVGQRTLGVGDAAATSFEYVMRMPHNQALVLAKPHTGRTNQIRLHLRACGHPVCGDNIYGKTEHDLSAPADPVFSRGTLQLHALALEFDHPHDRHRMRVLAPIPAWATGGDRG